MKKMTSKKVIIALSAAALCMTGALTLEHAAAYFTTYVSAGGSQVVHLGSQTEIFEEVSAMTKHISIKNGSQVNDCFVRVKVFNSSEFEVTYEDKSNLWEYSTQDEYCYYKPILPADQSTEPLDVRINDLPVDFDRDSFNVVVVQECTPVVYDESGNPSANWDTVYTDYTEVVGTQEEGGSQ